MITVRAGSGAIGVCLLLLMAGCSREQQDWRSAEAADTIEGYGQFIQRHPESELATQARTRVAQLGEDRDWQHAGSADTVDAYRDFIAQHPNGKWAQEARIRIENFSLGEQAGTDAGSKTAAGRTGGGGVGEGSSGAREGTGAAGQAPPVATASSGARSYGLASPGEAAMPAGSPATSGTGSSGVSNGGHASAAVTAPVRTGASAKAATAAAGSAPQSSGAASASASGSGGAHPAPPSTAAQAGSNPSGSAQGSQPRAGHPPSKAGFGIQLGAFTTEGGATTEWHLLTSRYASELQGLQEHVVPADTAAGRIYRLQAVVGDEGHARSICDLLRRRGQACVAVLPH